MSRSIDEVTDHLRERADYYIKWYQPTYDFCDEVVVALNEFSGGEYNLLDMFSEEIITKHILEHCLPPLQAYAVGGKVTGFISSNPGGVKEIDHSSTIPIYKKVVGEWCKNNWVEIKYDAEKRDFPIEIQLVGTIE
ncbi:hypothetical protein ACG1BZ_06605 [Microbulbifer sp. CNSA002]|uniref:hypothetical protein n=1 Tax=unclassified Microbulbifer TaxID=2619833 RepID=UPI0039B55081